MRFSFDCSAPVRDFSARSDISIDSIERNGGLADVQVSSGVVNNQTHDIIMQNSSVDAWLDALTARGAKLVQVTYPRTANNDKELTVARGEYLEILDDTRKWWKARNMRGQMAHVPHTIVTPFSYTGNNANSANAAGASTANDSANDAFNGSYPKQIDVTKKTSVSGPRPNVSLHNFCLIL